MLITVAVISAVLAFAVAAFFHQRYKLVEGRSYVDELDSAAYSLDLDTPARRAYLEMASAPATEVSRSRLRMALLQRAEAVLPSVEQLNRDNRRARFFARRSYVPNAYVSEVAAWEELLKEELHDIRREAERLETGWSRQIFAQAYKRASRAPRAVPWSWSQNEDHVALAVLIPPGVQKEDIRVAFEAQACRVRFKTQDMVMDLSRPICPGPTSRWRVTDDAKALHIWMEKETKGEHWDKCMRDSADTDGWAPVGAPAGEVARAATAPATEAGAPR